MKPEHTLIFCSKATIIRVIFWGKFSLENIKIHFKRLTLLLKGHTNTIKLLPPPRRPITYNFHSGKFPDYRFLFVCVFKPCLHYLAWVKFWNSVSFVILPSIIKRHFTLRPDLLGHWLYSLSASFLSYLAERYSFSPPYRVLAIIVIFKYSQLLSFEEQVIHAYVHMHVHEMDLETYKVSEHGVGGSLLAQHPGTQSPCMSHNFGRPSTPVPSLPACHITLVDRDWITIPDCFVTS